MPAIVDTQVVAELQHRSDAGDKIAKVLAAMVSGTHCVSHKINGAAPSVAFSFGNSFPLTNLATTTLVVKLSTDTGSTFPTTRTHIFGAGPFNSLADVITDINGDAAFLGTGATGWTVAPWADSPTELAIISNAGGSNVVIGVDISSTGINGAGLLAFVGDPTQEALGGGAYMDIQIRDQVGRAISKTFDILIERREDTSIPIAILNPAQVGKQGTKIKTTGSVSTVSFSWVRTNSSGFMTLPLLNFTFVTSGSAAFKFVAVGGGGETELIKVSMPLP